MPEELNASFVLCSPGLIFKAALLNTAQGVGGNM